MTHRDTEVLMSEATSFPSFEHISSTILAENWTTNRCNNRIILRAAAEECHTNSLEKDAIIVFVTVILNLCLLEYTSPDTHNKEAQKMMLEFDFFYLFIF